MKVSLDYANERRRLELSHGNDLEAEYWRGYADAMMAYCSNTDSLAYGEDVYKLQASLGSRRWLIASRKALESAKEQGAEIEVVKKTATKADLLQFGKTVFRTKEEAEELCE